MPAARPGCRLALAGLSPKIGTRPGESAAALFARAMELRRNAAGACTAGCSSAPLVMPA